MKLVKLMNNYVTPLKETVYSVFPRDLEEDLKANYILVSDFLYEKLTAANVKMFVYNTFLDSSVKNIIDLSKNDYYVVKEVIDPTTFDPDNYTIPEGYKVNDIVFVHSDPPVAPEMPVAPKFHSGTFNYELTETDKKILMDAYTAKMEQYEIDYEAYLAEYETYKTNVMSLPHYNAIGIIVNPTEKYSEYPIDLYNDNINKYTVIKEMKLLIIASVKPETTKDMPQFGEFGKLPNEMPTKVTETIGGLTAGTSLKGWTGVEILTKLFGLVPEKEKVGTIQPDGEDNSKITPTVSYGEGKTAIGSLTDTATITATIKLPDDSPVTTIKLVKSDGTVVDSQAKADTVTFSVTGIDTTTSYTIKAVYTDPETSEEVVAKQTAVTVVVNFVAPTLGALSATPTTVDNTSTPVEFQITVNEGSAPITSVKLYTSNNIEVGNLTPIDLNDNVYGYTLNSVTETTGYYVIAKDANNSEKKSNTVNVTLNIVAPTVTLAADKNTVTSKSEAIVFTAIVTASKAITSVKLYKEDGTEVGTMTLDGTNYTYTVNGITESTGFFAKATDEDSVEGNSAVKNITLNISEPTITLVTDKNSVTSSTDSVVFTATVTAGSGSITKVELYKSDDTKVADMVLDGSNYVYTVTGLTENTTFYAKATNSEDLFKKSANKAITVNITAPTVTLVVSPTSVGNTTTPVTFTATVTNTSGTITSVELYKSDDTKVGNMTLDGSTYAYTLNTLTETTTFYAKATNSETRSGVSTNKTVTLTMTGPNATLTANPASLTTVGNVTLTANVTAGSSAITQVELFDNSTATGTAIETETSGFDDLSWEIQDVDETCAYSIKVTDANGLTKTASANITFTVQNPTVNITASPNPITTKTADVVLTVTGIKKSFDLTKIEIFEGSASGTLLTTLTNNLTTAQTHTIVGVNAARTYTAAITDAKGNTGTNTVNVAYSYVAPTMTVNSVTPSSTDNPIIPSSVVTVAVVCSTAPTGATGTNVKLYRNSVATANLIETKTYAANLSFTVNGPQTNGDKFVAVLTYDSDGETKTAQKTSAAITVEVPPAMMYHFNTIAFNPMLANNQAADAEEEDVVDTTLADLTPEVLSSIIAQVGTSEYVKSQQPTVGEHAVGMKTVNVGPINGTIKQMGYLIPTTIADSKISFVANGSTPDTSTKNKHTIVTVDGTEYHLYMKPNYDGSNQLDNTASYKVVIAS